MKKIIYILSTLVLLSACNKEAQDTKTSKPAPASAQIMLVPETLHTDKWVGNWSGVEGLHLSIAKDESIGRGHYVLTMQYGLDADDSGTFKGAATEYGIRFTRPD